MSIAPDQEQPSFTKFKQCSVTVVAAASRHSENMRHLVCGLRALRASAALDIELVVVSERSGEHAWCREAPWVRSLLVQRTPRDALGEVVLEGLRCSERQVVVVMSADARHPPETIPQMLEALERGADLVLGSRFAAGGSGGHDRRVRRSLDARIATLLARPLTKVTDPTSGFFALRRTTFANGRDFEPVGEAIALELIVKCGCSHVTEVPIEVEPRVQGGRTVSVEEWLSYLKHVRRLCVHKYGTWSHLVQFLTVGSSGLIVNLALLTTFLSLRVPDRLAVGVAIALSIVWNFLLNRRISFSYAREQPVLPQFVGFVGACSVGAVANYLTTSALWDAFDVKQIAAVVGILAGTAFNFAFSRLLVFRKSRP